MSLEKVKLTARGHLYPEAYCLMWYQCQNCHHMERFYNARDGVTPFIVHNMCIECENSPMKHIKWEHDTYLPNNVPLDGQAIFIDMPEELKPVIGRLKWHQFHATGHGDGLPDIDTFVQRHVASYPQGAPWCIRWPQT